MKDTLTVSNVSRRMRAKTPKFWKKVRNIGIAVGSVSAVLLAAPVALPAALLTAATYGVVVGGVTAALSQVTEVKPGVTEEK